MSLRGVTKKEILRANPQAVAIVSKIDKIARDAIAPVRVICFQPGMTQDMRQIIVNAVLAEVIRLGKEI